MNIRNSVGKPLASQMTYAFSEGLLASPKKRTFPQKSTIYNVHVQISKNSKQTMSCSRKRRKFETIPRSDKNFYFVRASQEIWVMNEAKKKFLALRG